MARVAVSANLLVVRLFSPLTALVLFLSVVPSQPSPSFQNSRRIRLFKQHSTVVWSCGSPDVQAIVYQAGFAVDADGAYRAYHPNNRLGLDSINHAGHPGNWWALATDTGSAKGHPVVQGKNDPAPGYYVSMTALYDSSIADEHNPKRFVDAASVPYVVLPPAGLKHARLGDFATIVNFQNNKVAGAIIGDESTPELPMGEGSIALAKMLDIDANPRTGGMEEGVVAYVVYSDSGNREPRPRDEIARISQAHFEQWGGLRKLHDCLQ